MSVLSLSSIRCPSDELHQLELIGEGGFCFVYKALHSTWGTVAYKKLQVELIKEPEASRLMEEASIHAPLDHTNIVKMLGLVFELKNYGLILEFMKNGDLSEYLHKHNVDWKGKLDFICDVAAGMNYLHEQSPPIIHGDLKIINVLISENNRAKVCDFGFSQWKKFSELNSVNVVRLGTVTHIPPENWKDSHLRKTETFDVYGFGIFVWEVVTQKRPFDQGMPDMIREWVIRGQRPGMDEFPDDVPVETKNLMESCWDQDSKNRPTFQDIKKDLIKLKDTEKCLRHLAKFKVKDEEGVMGVAWLENKIYVACRDSNLIHVYSDKKPFCELKAENIKVTGMKEPYDMTASQVSRSIFVIEAYQRKDGSRCLWKIQLPDLEISPWSVVGCPRGLSVTSTDELVVVNEKLKGSYLDIYRSSDMRWLQSVPLPPEFCRVCHAVQLSDGKFVVSHSNRNSPDVFLITKLSIGNFEVKKKTFDLRSIRTVQLNDWYPVHLAVDKDDELFVADSSYSRRVVLLNPRLAGLQILLNKDQHRINRPTCLCYLQNKQQLVIGQWSPADVFVLNLNSSSE